MSAGGAQQVIDWDKDARWNGEIDDDSFVRTDEFKDVRASLLLLQHALHATPEEPAYWKWAILAAHSAVQSACVCILTRTDGGGALTDESEEKLLYYHDTESQRAGARAAGGELASEKLAYPNERVASLPELLRRLPCGMKIDIPGKGGTPKDRPTADFKMLHSLRNKFTHFKSVGLSIEIADLLRILERAVNLVEEITFSNQYQRFNYFTKMNLENVFKGIRKTLREL